MVLDETHILTIVSLSLFFISEILGLSKCQYNGILDVVFKGCCTRARLCVDPSRPQIINVV
jgi:hypothetical protein